ncbi:MAG: hypothetical protein HY775_04530 [Acidobacteria bacterium]|nr:hypothetical protein [Acidobacteriota bacterium]
MENVRVVLAHDDPRLREEMALLLEAAPDILVASLSPESATGGEVVVAGGEALARIAARAGGPGPALPLVALAGGDAIGAARAALAAGAHDILRWPADRDRLPEAVREAAGSPRAEPAEVGRAAAVLSARGGAGATTFAAALAGAFASGPAGATVRGFAAAPGAGSGGGPARHRAVILLDLDPAGGGQARFAPEPPSRTRADLDRLVPNLPAEALRAVLAPHLSGALALYAPERPSPLAPEAARALLGAARSLAAVVVADLGRGTGPGAEAAAVACDARVVLATEGGARGVLALSDRIGASFDLVFWGSGAAARDLSKALGLEPLAAFRGRALGPLAQFRTGATGSRSGLARAARRTAAALEERWGSL